MRAIAIFALCLASVAAVPRNPQRIVGGSVTTIDQYPSLVALLYPWDQSTYVLTCGGTILNTRVILTAGTCLYGDTADQWRARIGSTYANSGGVLHDFQSLLIHADFDTWTLECDIAVMRTSTAMVFNNFASAGFIAGTNYEVGDGVSVYAAGWGITSLGGDLSEQLRHVEVWTVSLAECQRRFGTLDWPVATNMLCSGYIDVGGRDQCHGDIGGPLYHNNVVVGVSSWVSCADTFFPSVNTKVSSFTNWIVANA